MEITDLFEIYLERSNGDIEKAEEYFREAMSEDNRLHKEYLEWCDEVGYTNRKGFKCYFMNKPDNDPTWDHYFHIMSEYSELEIDRI